MSIKNHRSCLMRRSAFTLVEIIVVIAILSILAVIGFMSYSSVNGTARDGVRKSDLSDIGRAFEAAVPRLSLDTTCNNGKYGTPFIGSGTTTRINLCYGTIAASSQTGANLLTDIGVRSALKDPAGINPYIYVYNPKTGEMEIAAIMESSDSLSFITRLYAASSLYYVYSTFKKTDGMYGLIPVNPPNSGDTVNLTAPAGLILMNTSTSTSGSPTGAPAVPTLLTPSNGTGNVSTGTISLTWSAVSGATKYKVYIGTATGVWNVNNGALALAPSFSTMLSANTTYYWTVEAWNATVGSAKAGIWSFTTAGAIAPSPYTIANSLLFDSGSGQYLSRTQSAGSLRKQFTISTWIKRSKLGINQQIMQAYWGSQDFIEFGFGPADNLMMYSIQGGTDYGYVFAPQYRDLSAWMHIVFVVDTPNATAGDRFQLYVNGTRVTQISGNYGDPPQNYATDFLNTGFTHTIARNIDGGTYTDGYFADTYLIDGQALAPVVFAGTDTTTGQWLPKAYTGTYGTNGYRLTFSSGASAATLGYDYQTPDRSGTKNDWTVNGSMTAAANQMIDTPNNNFATLNLLANTQTLSVWNLKAYGTSTSATHGTMAIPINVPTYFEVANITQTHANLAFWCGIVGSTLSPTLNYQVSGIPRMAWFYSSNYQYVMKDNGTYTQVAAAPLLANDIIKIAVSGNNMWVGKNTIWYDSAGGTTGNPATWANPTTTLDAATTYVPYVHLYLNTAKINFWQYAFTHTPPTGFKALSTANLPTPTIAKSKEYFDVLTYTGTSAIQTISGLAFQPDLVWTKGRLAATYNNHILVDSVRGTGKILQSNQTAGEGSVATSINSFNSNGFSVGAFDDVNTNNNNYSAWSWKRWSLPGFDILSYTGNGTNLTLNHSLGAVPKLVFVKERTGTRNWFAYHDVLGPTKTIEGLNTTNPASTQNAWNNTAPTSTGFSIGPSNPGTNTAGNGFIAYLWSEVPGFSKFGSYTGNGLLDGPFIYTGFQPKYVMIKRSDATDSGWGIKDSARNPYNTMSSSLFANSPSAESWYAINRVDFTSNGFKIREDTSLWYHNVSGGTYIYAAFAEAPFKYANAR